MFCGPFLHALLASLGAYTLPSYALGQPIEDARLVVPVHTTMDRWLLRCAGEPGAPAGLATTNSEKAEDVQRCWPMEIVEGREERSAYPRRGAVRATQEIEFLKDEIVRIKITRYFGDDPGDVETTVKRKPREADFIDSLE